MAKKNPVLTVLKYARNLISNGWIKEIMHATDIKGCDCYCAVGAVRQAAWEEANSDRWNVADAAICELAKGLPGRGDWDSRIVNWNDNPRRTKAQVLDRFDRTISRLEGKA